MSEQLQIDTLSFTLHRSVNRKTVGITVERDASLTLHAPIDCPLEIIEQIASKRTFWVYTKLAEKKKYATSNGRLRLTAPSQEGKKFVDGDKFYYLGKNYRLQLIEPAVSDDIQPALRLYQGRFMLKRDAALRAEEHFIKWYTEHGKTWISRKVKQLAHRLSIAPPPIRVQDLGFRWGSCSRNGVLNFHWRVILLPPKMIEYLVAHELVHLSEPHHTSDFWQRLERIMPDCATRKEWLDKNGGRFD